MPVAVLFAPGEDKEVRYDEQDDGQVQPMLEDVDGRSTHLQTIQTDLPVPKVSEANAGQKGNGLKTVDAHHDDIVSRVINFGVFIASDCCEKVRNQTIFVILYLNDLIPQKQDLIRSSSIYYHMLSHLHYFHIQRNFPYSFSFY